MMNNFPYLVMFIQRKKKVRNHSRIYVHYAMVLHIVISHLDNFKPQADVYSTLIHSQFVTEILLDFRCLRWHHHCTWWSSGKLAVIHWSFTRHVNIIILDSFPRSILTWRLIQLIFAIPCCISSVIIRWRQGKSFNCMVDWFWISFSYHIAVL